MRRTLFALLTLLWVGVGCECGGPGTCKHLCQEGERKCSESGIMQCTLSKITNCYEWKLEPCPEGESCTTKDKIRCVPTGQCQNATYLKRCVGQDIYWFDDCGKKRKLYKTCPADASCQKGACQQCKDSCTAGEGKCSPSGWISYCYRNSKTGCLEWSPSAPCPDNKTCTNNSCGASSCQSGNECTPGKTRCSGTQIQSCAPQKDGCFRWGTAQDCPPNKTCSHDSCGGASCPNPCKSGESRCSNGKLQQCKQQADGCFDWDTPQACPSGQTCQNGSCTTGSCQNQCVLGKTRCSGTQQQTCEKQATGCTDWSPPQNCPQNKACTNDRCPATCQDKCTAGQKQCSGGKIQSCEKQTSGCLDWAPAQACPSGQTCKASGNDAQCVQAAKWEAERQTCADEINKYRKKHNLSPLSRDSGLESYGDKAAASDASTGKPHGYFSQTRGGGVSRGECEIPGWPQRSYGSVSNIIIKGILMMYNETPPNDGHRRLILKSSFTKTGCGIHVTSSGKVWIAIEFR